MEFPISINVKSVNVGNDTFMYDGDTGFLTKSTGLLNDVHGPYPMFYERENCRCFTEKNMEKKKYQLFAEY